MEEVVLPGVGGVCNLGVSLFARGNFTLASGAKSSWKLECDALTDADWDGAAAMARILYPQFSEVVGVPRGGLKLAERLQPFATPGSGPILIVDDVLTTGDSMARVYNEVLDRMPEEVRADRTRSDNRIMGLVLFARGQCPWWVRAIFQMPEPFWIKPRTGR